jgi:para-aminobenzoate synthetase/4-amino-4-deoxychorismate lyase
MELLETMRAEDGRIELLERHLARLATAGRALGYPVDILRVRDTLAGALQGAGPTLLVRLTVDPEGRIAIETVPVELVPPIRTAVALPWPAASAPERSRFKTTDRVAYDVAMHSAWAAGVDEAILVDDNGWVVEATRANVWVRDGDELLTPPLSKCGLPGVMRDHILETVPGARIAVVRAEDLSDAEEVLLSNAVRGLFPVRIGTPPAGRA